MVLLATPVFVVHRLCGRCRRALAARASPH
jgi:hypothetical protein